MRYLSLMALALLIAGCVAYPAPGPRYYGGYYGPPPVAYAAPYRPYYGGYRGGWGRRW